MKCRVCGCELNPAKRYCERCGAFIEGPVKPSNGEFAWNTIDFPKPKKMEDIEMTWPGMNTPSNESYMNSDASEGFVSQTSDDDLDAKPKKEQAPVQAPVQPQMQYTAPQQFTWTMPSSVWTIPPQQPVAIPPAYGVQPMPTMQPVQPAPVMPTMQPVQPVYVQPLYMTQPLPVQTIPATMQTIPGVPPVTMPTMQGFTQAPATPNTIPTPGSVNLDSWLDEQLKASGTEIKDKDQFFTFYQKNEDFQKLLDAEYERYKNKFNTNADSLKVQSVLEQAASKIDTIPGKKTSSQMTKAFSAEALKQAMAKEEPAKDIVSGESLTDFDRMILEGTTSSSETGDSTLVISNEELKREINEIAAKAEAAYSRQDLEAMIAAREAFLNKEGKALDDQTSAVEIKSIFDEWDKERAESEKKAPKKKGGFGKFLLILLILIALFVGADFATIKWLGDSPVTEFFTMVNNKSEDILEKVEEKTGLDDLIGKKEENQEPEKELTLQEQAVKLCNTNIEVVTCDVSTSKYSSQENYGFDGIGSMAIVTDEDTIIDVTETLVKYNCAWIDYVNSGNDISCFDYLRADGEAFRSASNYDGLGKVKETFKKLNIGEIRKDSKYVYAFADEFIVVTKGDVTAEVPARMIYQMELIGDMYKIVQYDSYK